MKRRYSLDSKIAALNQIDQLDGDLTLAGQQLNIPIKTLEKWRAKEPDLRQNYRQRQNASSRTPRVRPACENARTL